ncbi:Amino-transferase [Gracilaria domingensis]|nr:Amino-transferase [Gracilaria domingensis]
MDLGSRGVLPLFVECVPSSDAKCVRVSHNVSLSDFMNGIPRAAYTTFVSVYGTHIPQIGFHVDRIMQGVSSLFPQAEIPPRSSIMSRVCSIVDDAFAQHSQVGYELQFLAALIEGVDKEILLRVHISRTKSFDQSSSPVTVECRGQPRRDPHVKNSAWYRERKPLQFLRAKEAYETILVGTDSHGHMALIEGLISNFFVITKDMQVYTAPDDVILPGSIRRLVLRACEELGVTVREEAPRLIDWRRFAIGFLTNARTWLLPVCCILVPLADHREKGVEERLDLPAQDCALELLEGIRQVVYNLALKDAYVPQKFCSGETSNEY